MSKFTSRKWYIAVFMMAITGSMIACLIYFLKSAVSMERIEVLKSLIIYCIGYLALYSGLNTFQKFIPGAKNENPDK